jgi:dihydrofolate reductase
VFARRDLACLFCEPIQSSYYEEIVQKIEKFSNENRIFKHETLDFHIGELLLGYKTYGNLQDHTRVLTNTPISSAHSPLRQCIIYYFSDSVNNDHIVEENGYFRLL